MKLLRATLDKVEPLFHKGGRFERLYPIYEATDTFLYTPADVTHGPSHVRDGMDLKRMMSLVIVGLIPAIFMACWNTGYQANRVLVSEAEANIFIADPSGTLGKLTPEQKSLWDRVDAIEAEQANLKSAIEGKKPPADAQAQQAALQQELVEAQVEQAIVAKQLAHQTGWRGQILDATTGIDPDSFLSNFLHGLLWFLPVYLVTIAVGGNWEALFSIVRGHEINEGFLVTSMLFPLTLPPTVPLWQVALGITFGVVIGKEVFGGTGRNFLNPALTSRAFLYFAYAQQMSGDKVWNAATAVAPVADGYSAATTLNTLNVAGAKLSAVPVTWFDSFLGTIEGSMGETSTLAALIGAVVLVGVGVGSWRVMTGCVIGLVAFSGLLCILAHSGLSKNAMWLLPPWWHLVVGGFAFGAVFMATDPVSAAMTRTGMWWYGILIGIMTMIIRAIGPAFPEGIMLAILFGNVFAPLIDYFVVQANIKRRQRRIITNVA